MLRWLQQLRLAHKFIILGAVALVMMAVPTSLYLQYVLRNLNQAQQASAAMAPLTAISQIVRDLQIHRGTTASMLGGDSAMKARRPTVSGAVDKAFARRRTACRPPMPRRTASRPCGRRAKAGKRWRKP